MFYSHNQARLKLPRQRRRVCQPAQQNFGAYQKSPVHKRYQSIVTNTKPLIPRDNDFKFKNNVNKGILIFTKTVLKFYSE